MEHFDVLIVGAGLSGVGAACHLRLRCPGKSFAILEGREAMGGTWDLFRYPGVRSDSDMFTLGYRFKPWTDTKTLADGPAILSYVKETAREHGVEDKIRYGHRVTGLSWSSEARQGDPAKVLVELAESVGADLLVIGNKGMERKVLGSVPNTVSHHAPCSVLIVKTT